MKLAPCQHQPRDRHPVPLTSLLGRLVVRLAHQPAIFHEVEFVACGQLPLAHHAGEAVQVVYEVLGAAHHLCGRDAQLARGALGPESPAGHTGRGSAQPWSRRRRLRWERVGCESKLELRLPVAWCQVQEESAWPCALVGQQPGLSHMYPRLPLEDLQEKNLLPHWMGKVNLEGQDSNWANSLRPQRPKLPPPIRDKNKHNLKGTVTSSAKLSISTSIAYLHSGD